jgi:hypothetical protein
MPPRTSNLKCTGYYEGHPSSECSPCSDIYYQPQAYVYLVFCEFNVCLLLYTDPIANTAVCHGDDTLAGTYNQQQSEFLGTKLTSNQQHQPASDINKVSKRRTIRRKKLIFISSRGYRLCAHPLFMFISLFACLFELRNLPFTLPGLPITRSFR